MISSAVMIFVVLAGYCGRVGVFLVEDLAGKFIQENGSLGRQPALPRHRPSRS